MISIPFSGSKKNSYKRVKEIIGDQYDLTLEPFGGSGVLSVNLFNDGLVNKAVVNDFDHFFDDYETYLDYKDLIVSECTKRGVKKIKEDKNGYYYLDDNGNKVRVGQMTLGKEWRTILQSVIKENVPEKYWHYLLRGTNFGWGVVLVHDKIHLSDFNLFSRQLETTKQRQYLEILNRINLEHLDWKNFINKYRDEINSNKSILILDPPYIGADQRQYKEQFTEEDTLELINTVKELNCDFIIFNHDIEKVKEWLDGLNYSIGYSGKIGKSANRSRKDVIAYVKNSDTSN